MMVRRGNTAQTRLHNSNLFGRRRMNTNNKNDDFGSKMPSVALTAILGAATVGWAYNMYSKKVGPFERFASEEEKLRREGIRKMRNNDPRKAHVSEKVFMDVEIDDVPEGRIVIGLFGDMLPRTCKNFSSICEGFKNEESGKILSYRGTPFHRVVRGFMAQGGDCTCRDGTGGLSIYGEQFEDEKFQFAHVRGAVSMANRGPDTNSSQFFICMSAAPHLNGRHVVFGRLLEGEEVLDKIEAFGSSSGTPKRSIKIVDCGIVLDP